jgi:transposase
LVERQPAPDEPDKALACFGAVRQDTAKRFLFFCEGQPNTDSVILMLQHLLQVAASEGKRVLVIIWDRASWHKSQKLRRWIRAHNQFAKRHGQVRLLTCLLPTQSPWLNPMEAHWVHAKRKVAQPDGALTAVELKRRLCAHFDVDLSSATLK